MHLTAVMKIDYMLNLKSRLYSYSSSGGVMYLFDSLTLGGLSESNHVLRTDDLNKGKVRVLGDLSCKGRLATVRGT